MLTMRSTSKLMQNNRNLEWELGAWRVITRIWSFWATVCGALLLNNNYYKLFLIYLSCILFISADILKSN